MRKTTKGRKNGDLTKQLGANVIVHILIIC